MKKLSFIAFAALLLSGCSLTPYLPEPPQPEPAKPVVKPKPSKPINKGESIPVPPTKPVQPVQIQIDWQTPIHPLVAKMVQVDGVTPGSILLVTNVKNATNGSLPVQQATVVLRNDLANSSRFALVSDDKISSAKQMLGLSDADSLASRSKAIGLARYVGAQYVLYTTVNGDVKQPDLGMQLMLVQTGEIIWSGHAPVQR